MSDLTKIPLQDNFTTTLTQELDTSSTTVYVATVPDFTYPAGVTSYLVLNPGKTTMEIVTITAHDSSASTITIGARNQAQGASITTSAQTHTVGSSCIISDNYAFWLDIQTSIGTKVDKDDDSIIADTKQLQFGATDAAIWTDDTGTNMQFKDGSNAAITLSTIAAAAGADTKVGITVSDTTTATLDTKLTAGDGISKTVVSPGGAETLDLDVDTSDTATFVKLSSGAGDEDKVPVLDASGQLAVGFLGTLTGQLVYGDGSDGALTTTGDVTLARDMYYTDLSVTSGDTIYTKGHRIYCTGTLECVGTGKIDSLGGVGTVGANAPSTSAGGAGGAAGTQDYTYGTLPAPAIGALGGHGVDDGGASGTAGTAGSGETKPLSNAAGVAGGAGGAGGAANGTAAGAAGAKTGTGEKITQRIQSNTIRNIHFRS